MNYLISDVEIFGTLKKETYYEASALRKMYLFNFYSFCNYNIFVMIL